VPDSSAWIEYLRATGSTLDLAMVRLLDEHDRIAVTEIIVMEVLAGIRNEIDLARTRRQLLGFPLLKLHGLDGFERAAALYRSCRRAGETVRHLSDCLIAVPVIDAGAELLHADRDFDAIARHTDLRIASLDG
jgi:predicted nucleic acid-binding protein